MNAQNDALFADLKKLLAPYAEHFNVHEDTDEVYDLEEELPGYRTMFAVLMKRPKDVRLFFYPLHIFPELRAQLPASLEACVSGKWVIKLASLAASDKKALAKLVADAWQRIAAIRALDKTHPYHRKFDLEDTHALITTIAQSARGAVAPTVELRKKDVQVTLAKPPKALPPVLAPRQFKPGVFRFKTITPAEHAVLAKLVR